MTLLIKKNKRVAKKLNKKYRFYESDVWGKLGLKNKKTKLTKLIKRTLIYQFGKKIRKRKFKLKRWKKRKIKRTKKRSMLFLSKFNKKIKVSKRKRKVLKKLKKLKKLKWKATFVKRMPFLYMLSVHAKYKRRRGTGYRGRLLKYRRQISLFYGGGRIRKKTFRRYARMLNSDHKEKREKGSIIEFNNFSSLIESRIDVLLFRANFVDTIYQARQFVFHKLARVIGHKVIKNPGHIVKIWEPFMLRDNIWKKMRFNLYKKILEKKIISFPNYLYINLVIMLAFKMKDPLAYKIKYPFSITGHINLAFFRHSFRVL